MSEREAAQFAKHTEMLVSPRTVGGLYRRAEMLAKLNYDYHCVMGEHDYYLDLGEYWSELYGDQYYSFDHKGVHFVVLNSILTYDDWTLNRWPTAEQRMLEMAGLDNPNGSPFMVGEKQRRWLAQDLAGEDEIRAFGLHALTGDFKHQRMTVDAGVHIPAVSVFWSLDHGQVVFRDWRCLFVDWF